MKCRGKNCNELEPPNMGYLAKSEWMRVMSKTHKQQKCHICGLYTVWVKK